VSDPITAVTDKLSQAVTSTSQALVGTLMVLGGIAGLGFRTKAGQATVKVAKSKLPIPEGESQ